MIHFCEQKRDKRWLISLTVAVVVGVLGLLFPDLVFDLVLELGTVKMIYAVDTVKVCNL